MSSNGIAIIEYPLHATITLQDVESEYQQRLNITGNNIPILVKAHGVASFSNEAQIFLCSKKYTEITAAVAVVFDTEAGYFEHSKLLVDLFKSMNPPSFEVRAFDDIEIAKDWLKTYL